MTAKVNQPFFFETAYEGEQHSHYGRFFRVGLDRLLDLTWVTWWLVRRSCPDRRTVPQRGQNISQTHTQIGLSLMRRLCSRR